MENKLKFVVLLSCFLLSIIKTGQSAKILFYFGVATYSHRIAVWPLAEELAERGHNVTFLSGFLPTHPNPKVIELVPKGLREFMEDESDNVLEHRIQGNVHRDWEALPSFGVGVCSVVLKDPEIREWVKRAEFDLVIIDGLFNECGLGLAYVFKAKVIMFSTSSALMWQNEILGVVSESSWIPEMDYFYKEPMTFLQRVHNTIIPIYWHLWIRKVNYFPELEGLIRKELDIPEMPSLRELEKNTSLFFLTTHYSIEYARSLPPVYVSIAGLHIVESNKTLSQDLSKFIEESGPGGVIYVSFGSAAKFSKLPSTTKSVLYEVFGSFKSTTRFIWKIDIDRPKDLPDNIMAVKWVPQQELFAHTKIKAFVSHAGLGGIQEATYYGIPMIVFPLFAEQDYNANIIEKIGCGIKLEIIGIKKEELSDAVSKILNDNRYKLKMVELSNLFKDRPIKPLETAVWWTEYILRHNDTSSLKPLSLYLTWYQRRLVDVWFFLFFLLLSTVVVVFYIFFKCAYRNTGSNGDYKLKQS